MFLFRQPATKIEDLMLKFPHLPEKIFQKLNDNGLVKSREIARSWQNFIDEKSYPWLRIVNIPIILKDGNTYLHIAAETGQIEKFNTALREAEDINIKTSLMRQTPFHRACMRGQFEIVELLLKNTVLNVEPNGRDNCGSTSFILACLGGHLNIAKLFLENSVSLGIDLNARDISAKTAFHQTCIRGHSEVIKMFMENAVAFNIDLNAKDGYGGTGFMWACCNGHADDRW